MLRASTAAEKMGIPAVSVISTPFMAMARAFAKGRGLAEPAIAEYQGFPMMDSAEQLRDKVVNSLLPQILDGWAKRGQPASFTSGSQLAEPGRRDIVFRGSYQQVQDYFDAMQWSDGLPVSPPTIARVEEFLKFTDRSPDEVLGVCQPEGREATIWNVAVNGVMSGCLPEYMPVLVALTEAMLDPAFCLDFAGSAPGFEPLIILSGSIVNDLDFNYGGGVMRVGRRANSSIGRFTRLFMRNIPGQRIPAGGADKATGLKFGGTDKVGIGMSFNVVLAENDEATAAIGWEPFRIERGFGRDDNVVTVQSCIAITAPVHSAGTRAEEHAEILAEAIGPIFHYRSFTGFRDGMMYPLFVVSPVVAKAMVSDGWSKDDLRKYLHDKIRMPAKLIAKYARSTNGAVTFDFKQLVAKGKISGDYCDSDDPDRLVRALIKPEMIEIVIAGDPEKNQSRGYAQNARRGAPVSRQIRLPEKWRDLLQQAQGERARLVAETSRVTK